jgi:hypothetical protein
MTDECMPHIVDSWADIFPLVWDADIPQAISELVADCVLGKRRLIFGEEQRHIVWRIRVDIRKKYPAFIQQGI